MSKYIVWDQKRTSTHIKRKTVETILDIMIALYRKCLRTDWLSNCSLKQRVALINIQYLISLWTEVKKVVVGSVQNSTQYIYIYINVHYLHCDIYLAEEIVLPLARQW